MHLSRDEIIIRQSFPIRIHTISIQPCVIMPPRYIAVIINAHSLNTPGITSNHTSFQHHPQHKQQLMLLVDLIAADLLLSPSKRRY